MKKVICMKTKQRTLIVLLVLVFLAGGAFAALTAKNLPRSCNLSMA